MMKRRAFGPAFFVASDQMKKSRALEPRSEFVRCGSSFLCCVSEPKNRSSLFLETLQARLQLVVQLKVLLCRQSVFGCDAVIMQHFGNRCAGDFALADVQAIPEVRIGHQGFSPAHIGDLDRIGQGGVVQRIG
jgi:hypothetical protein